MNKILNKKHHYIPHNAIYIGRGSKWGNPYRMHHETQRSQVIEQYRHHLGNMYKEGKINKEELAGMKNAPLVCFCSPKPCHGDILTKAIQWATGHRKNPPW